MKMHVIAVKSIAAGEEITVSYIQPGFVRADRLRTLFDFWGFICHCQLCLSSAIEIEESDARIALVNSLQQSLGNWENPVQVTDADTLIHTAMNEGIIPISGQYLLAAYTYSSQGQLEPAIEYAKKALESAKMFDGEKSTFFVLTKAFLDNPANHWTWMRRGEEVTGDIAYGIASNESDTTLVVDSSEVTMVLDNDVENNAASDSLTTAVPNDAGVSNVADQIAATTVVDNAVNDNVADDSVLPTFAEATAADNVVNDEAPVADENA
jgi:hypothetical protein